MHEVMFALMKLKERLVKEYHHPGFAIPNPTLNLGHIHGGDSANRICAVVSSTTTCVHCRV